MLAPVDRFLTDEAGHLTLEFGILQLGADVAHRTDEEVLALGKHRRQCGDEVPRDQVAVLGEVAGNLLECLVEGDAPGGHPPGFRARPAWSMGVGCTGGGHTPILDKFEAFGQSLN